MLRARNHQLPNLSLLARVLATGTLLAGFALFVSVWFASILMTGWGLSLDSFLDLGASLHQIRTISGTWFGVMLGLHAASLPVILGLAHVLFRRVALPRGARTALMAAPIALGTLDLLCWATLSVSPAARTALPFLLALESAFVLYLIITPLREMWVYTRWTPPNGAPVRVVIVGGGFGGLYAALGLDRVLGYHRGLRITVVDRKNYFLFPPMLPSVATGAIETRQVTYPFRRIFEATNVIFRKESVSSIDLETREVHTSIELGVGGDTARRGASVLPYDYLILAPGSETNTFRTEGADRYCFYMRELGDATALRNHIIDCFEAAAHAQDHRQIRELLRFVIVGGGPTGVELASEIQDLVDHILCRRYPEVDPTFVEVYIVQSAPNVLPGWDEGLITETTAQLQRLKIRQLLGTRVIKVGPCAVTLNNGEDLATRTVVWCAGVKPASLLARTALPRDRGGKVPVEADLRVAGHPEVFVLGDAASCPDPDSGKPLPALAQVALQQGGQTAENLRRLLLGQPTRPFKYFNYGSLLAVGEHFAVVDLVGLKLSGKLAWLIWRTLYVAKLVGFGNRVRVVLDWTLDLLVERSISQIWSSRRDLAESADDDGRDDGRDDGGQAPALSEEPRG